MDKDYFSTQAEAYKNFRPRYPQALFDYLLADLQANSLILDCATGNGQAALSLTARDATVLATDISLAQMSEAPCADRIHWIQASAECLPIPDKSVQLITIAQALHWFDFPRFYSEAARVLTPGGRIVAWTYSLLAICDQFGEEIADVMRWFYRDIVGPYWPPERRWVDEEYQTIPFPFEEIESPSFILNLTWNRPALLGYVSSWSAVQLYSKALGVSPLPLLKARLETAWPEPGSEKHITWPLSLRVGKHLTN